MQQVNVTIDGHPAIIDSNGHGTTIALPYSEAERDAVSEFARELELSIPASAIYEIDDPRPGEFVLVLSLRTVKSVKKALKRTRYTIEEEEEYAQH